MFTIFWKSVFTSFLLIILGFNLCFFFDNGGQVFQLGVGIDYSDKYFGFTSLVNFFQTGFNSSDIGSIKILHNFLSMVSEDVKRNLYGNWFSFAQSGGIYDLQSFFLAIGYFFANIFSFFEMLFYVLCMILYVIQVIVWIIAKVLLLTTGGFFNYAPPYTYA